MNIKTEKEMTFYLIDKNTLFIVEGSLVRSLMTLTSEGNIYLEYSCIEDTAQVRSLQYNQSISDKEATVFLETVLYEIVKKAKAEALFVRMMIFYIEYKSLKSEDTTEVIGRQS